MRLSSLIAPFRIYDQYHDLNKFNIDCTEGCLYDLISDKIRLLPIQFKRDASLYPIVQTWLRPECKDFYTELFPVSESKFISQANWVFTNTATIFENKALFQAPLPPGSSEGMYSSIPLVIGNKYRAKIVLSYKSISPGEAGVLCLAGPINTCISNISDVGTHIVDFTAADTLIGLESNVSGTGDYIYVSEFQIYAINDFSIANNNDYQLDASMFEVVNIGNIDEAGDKDIITYCGYEFENSLPCGRYYLIIKSMAVDPDTGTPFDTYFFSEIITIKNFLPSQSPYVLLEWNHSCDFQDVKYIGLDCDYVNRLYIDGPITKPEYPYVEEGSENGNQVFKAAFKKLEKKENIICAGVPEFLADSLMAIRLHDTIKFYRALKKKQQYISEFETVESLESDIEPILDDCFSTVNLKVLLTGRFISTACCVPIAIVEQGCGCDFTVVEYDVYPTPPVIGLYAFVDGVLYKYMQGGDVDGWYPQYPASGSILCIEGDYWVFTGGGAGEWVQIPQIETLVDNADTSFTVTGYSISGTAIQLKVVYNSITYILPTIYTNVQLAAGITVNYSSIPLVLINCLPMSVSARAFNAFCDYGFGPAMTIVPKADGSC